MKEGPLKKEAASFSWDREKEGSKEMTLKTEIKDKSVVTERASAIVQNVYVDFEELGDYFDWIKSQPEGDVVKKGALLTLNNLSEKNHGMWEKYSQKDQVFSLGQCIDA